MITNILNDKDNYITIFTNYCLHPFNRIIMSTRSFKRFFNTKHRSVPNINKKRKQNSSVLAGAGTTGMSLSRHTPPVEFRQVETQPQSKRKLRRSMRSGVRTTLPNLVTLGGSRFSLSAGRKFLSGTGKSSTSAEVEWSSQFLSIKSLL